MIASALRMFLSRIWIDSGGSIICDVVDWVCLLSITRLPSPTAWDMKLNPSVSRHGLLHDCVKASAISGNLSSRLFPYIRTNPALGSKKVPEIGGGVYVRGRQGRERRPNPARVEIMGKIGYIAKSGEHIRERAKQVSS